MAAPSRAASNKELDGLALRLRLLGGGSTGDGELFWANATLLSPRRAVTTHHVVARIEDKQRLWLWGRGREVPATIVASDPEVDFAVLEPEDIFPHAGISLASTVPRPGASWECVFRRPSSELARAWGVVGGTVEIDGRPHLELKVESPEDTPLGGLSGAPIMVDGSVVGIAARADGLRWYAISISAMAESRVTDAVRVLLRATPELFERLSISSKRALSQADAIRRSIGSTAVHMEHLIAGLYEKKDGPTQRLFHGAGLAPSDVRKLLSDVAEKELPETYPVNDVDRIPPSSAHVQKALSDALHIAEASGAAQLQSRHLLYGALSVDECHVVQALRERGIKKEDIQLTDPATTPAPTPTRALPELLAGLHTDSTTGTDLLDLKHEVAALSGVLVAEDVEPPISVGLFGDWGSGKSFFMNKMEEQIDAYAKGASDDAKSGKSNPFCKEVVQLKFNAWHYADKDLWASLASEIFERLSEKLEARVTAKGSTLSPRDRLLAAASSASDVLASAEKQEAAATRKLQETEQRLATLQKRDDEIEAGLSPATIAQEVVKAATQDARVQKQLDDAADKLGLQSADRAARDVRAELLELGKAAGFFWGVWRGLRRGGPRLWVLSLVTIVLVVVAVPVAIHYGLLKQLAAIVPVATGALAWLAKELRPIVARVNDAMKTVQSVQQANQETIERKRREREQEAEKERTSNRTQVEEAQKRVAQARSDLDGIQRRLDDMRADRQMAKFLRERFESADYTKQFGSIARARNDFERLCDLFKQAKSEAQDRPANQAEGPLGPPIDRIVIYIDDLDRCPEDKVVDVLQAVHLLLAFDLFVVVVGVDPRWLLHSLRQHSEAFREPEEEEAALDEEQVHWQSTPFSYLEKIFQIPFTLRPMESGGYEAMIDSLVSPMKRKKEATTERVEVSGAVEATSTEGTGTSQAPSGAASEQVDSGAAAPLQKTPAEQPPQPQQAGGSPPSPPPEPDREYLLISDRERAYMKLMFPLIPTPRSTNRYVNVYRLLRATIPSTERESFEAEGGDHRIVLLLLAMLTGNPAETTEIIRDLLETPHAEPWWDFLETYRGRSSTGAPDRETQMTAEGWRQLFERMEAIRKAVTDPWPATRFREWAPRVARYSFQSGRVLLAARGSSASVPRARKSARPAAVATPAVHQGLLKHDEAGTPPHRAV